MRTSATMTKVGDIQYFQDDPLFSDSFSTSYRGYNTNTHQDLIVRQFQTLTLTQIKNSNQLLSDEITLLKKLSHNNISKHITFYASKNNLYLIYDAANHGNLENYLKASVYIPEIEAVKHLHDILLGYDVIYKSGQILKSIRLNSFVLNENNIKFFDLNLFKTLEKFKGPNMKSDSNFFLSLAPEIFAGQQSTNCDVWSIGLIFYQMLFGEMPWQANNLQEFFKAVETQPLNLKNKHQKISKKTENVLLKMLQPDWKKRITYEKLLEDILFTKFSEDLQEREQKLMEKIKKNPESWQAASMVYNRDPLISIFDVSVVKTNSSQSTFKTVEEYKQMMSKSQRKFESTKLESNQPEPEQPLDLSASIIKKSAPRKKIEEELPETGNKVSDQELEDFMRSSMKKPSMAKSNTGEIQHLNNNAMSKEEFGGAENIIEKGATNKIIEEALEGTKDDERLNEEFRKYNNHIQRICDYLQIYSRASTTATKLFKTDLIILQCFFLYKRIMKSLTDIYGALARGENLFEFRYWNEYMNSFYFIRAADILEVNLERVEDIFNKLHKDCLKKLRNAKIKEIGIDSYISDDFENIEIHFHSFISTYLFHFVPSVLKTASKDQQVQIIKHQVEIIDALLLNKMDEFKIEESFVNIEEHKKILKTNELKEINAYLKMQFENLDLFSK